MGVVSTCSEFSEDVVIILFEFTSMVWECPDDCKLVHLEAKDPISLVPDLLSFCR